MVSADNFIIYPKGAGEGPELRGHSVGATLTPELGVPDLILWCAHGLSLAAAWRLCTPGSITKVGSLMGTRQTAHATHRCLRTPSRC